MLELVCCEPCQVGMDEDGYCDDFWCRVHTVRDGQHLVSELEFSLARRIVPRLLARYGVTTDKDIAGMWWQRVIFIRR